MTWLNKLGAILLVVSLIASVMIKNFSPILVILILASLLSLYDRFGKPRN